MFPNVRKIPLARSKTNIVTNVLSKIRSIVKILNVKHSINSFAYNSIHIENLQYVEKWWYKECIFGVENVTLIVFPRKSCIKNCKTLMLYHNSHGTKCARSAPKATNRCVIRGFSCFESNGGIFEDHDSLSKRSPHVVWSFEETVG